MDYVTIVTIHDVGSSSRPAVVMNAEGDQSIGVEWKDENTLIVYLTRSLRGRDFSDQPIGVQNRDVKGVHVDYVFLP